MTRKTETPSVEVTPLTVDEHVIAKAIGMSVHFIRKDRSTKRLLPFYRVGDRCLYNLDRVREALASLEEGGECMRGRSAGRKA